MGREVKRVAMDFSHPMKEIWPGYMPPDELDDEDLDKWYEHDRYDPPVGDGWQMWETTSEGSPISPVFATPEELARWLAESGASAMGAATATYEEWLGMIRGSGWACDMVIGPGGAMTGVAFAAATEREGT